jgi:hypothetical protein
MTQSLAGITAAQLRTATALKEKIEALEQELASLFQVAPPSAAIAPAMAPQPRVSTAGRDRTAAARKARWAKVQKAAAATPATKPKRRLSPEGRRRIIEATKARWARIRAAKAARGA